MSEFGEKHERFDAIENGIQSIETLRQEIETNYSVQNELLHALTHGIELTNDPIAVNHRLSQSGRPDLLMWGQAPLERLQSVDEVLMSSKATNFGQTFRMFSNQEATDETTGETYRRRIPVTSQELETLRTEGGRVDSGRLATNHSYREAFQRMLVLLPDLTKNLVDDMSRDSLTGMRNDQVVEKHKHAVFVAYAIMSRLVSTSDPYVRLKEDGSLPTEPYETGPVDSIFLFH